jgi:hypothetical protein
MTSELTEPELREPELREPESRQTVPPQRVAEKSAVAARQGVISGRVFLVLVTSLSLAVVALGMSYWVVH